LPGVITARCQMGPRNATLAREVLHQPCPTPRSSRHDRHPDRAVRPARLL
jgi:hypothetical protein